MIDFIKAYSGENNSVIYEDANGNKYQFSGGDPNWRNQNPGNVLSNHIQWDGKIGVVGRFCIFSNPEFGKRATRKILSNRRREKKTLAEAIHSYAPDVENNTGAYIKDVSNRTGILANTRLDSLSDVQMESIAQAMFIHEGTKRGTVTVLKTGHSSQTGQYIWHTAHDEKVRKDHAERDGKVFDFAHPPKVGTPVMIITAGAGLR